MSINRGIDKEDVVHVHKEYCSAIIKNEIVSSAETWMDLETAIWSKSKSERENQVEHDITYMWTLEK